MAILVCSCCKGLVQYNSSARCHVGEAERETGWYWGCTSGNASGRWYCITCMDTISTAVENLLTALHGDESVSLTHLRRLTTRHRGKYPLQLSLSAMPPVTASAQATESDVPQKTTAALKMMLRTARVPTVIHATRDTRDTRATRATRATRTTRTSSKKKKGS